jgi:hypothetical protein
VLCVCVIDLDRPTRPHIQVISLVGLNEADDDAEREENVLASLRNCDFLRKRKSRDSNDDRLDLDRQQRMTDRCLSKAELFSEQDRFINDVERCIMPRDWFAYVDDSATRDTRVYYCNVRSRTGRWSAHRRRKQRVHSRHNDADVSATPAVVQTLAMRIYATRYEKDLSRSMAEWRFFAQHGALSQLWTMPVVGAGVEPSNLARNDSAYFEHLARTLPQWDADRLDERVRQIAAFLGTQTTPPRLVYVHCEGGIDRTGELIGALELTRGATWRDVLQRAARVSGREMTRRHVNALQWYCHYWRLTQRQDLQCDVLPKVRVFSTLL